jgi:hypothetical protein
MPKYYVYDVTTGAIVHRHEVLASTWAPVCHVVERTYFLSWIPLSRERESLDVLEEVEPEAEPALC